MKYSFRSDGKIVLLCPLKSCPRSVLAFAAVSADWPRAICQIDGFLNAEKYLNALGPLVSPGRTIMAPNRSVHKSTTVKEWMSSRNTSSLLWPSGGTDIMPMTSIWNRFIRELNMATSIVTNSQQLWDEIEYVWNDFICNDDFILPATVGFVWLDLSNVVDESNKTN